MISSSLANKSPTAIINYSKKLIIRNKNFKRFCKMPESITNQLIFRNFSSLHTPKLNHRYLSIVPKINNLSSNSKLISVTLSSKFSSLAQHYEGVFPKDKFQPLMGDGSYLIDKNDEKILCCNSAYGAALTGYGRNYVTDALKKQLDILSTSSRAFHYPLLEKYADKLSSLYQFIPHGNSNDKIQVVFKEGGAAAVDAAIKIAKLYGHHNKGIQDGRQKILYAGGHDLFHGRSEAVMPPAEKNDSDPMTEGFGQVHHPFKKLIELNNIGQLEDAFKDPNLAGVIIEPILGEGGVKLPDKAYLEKIRELCNHHNVLLIYDEVQTTLRTGHLSATEHSHFDNARGDIYVAAKAVTAGVYPSSYSVGRESIMSLLKPGSEGSTFGASQLACVAGLATFKMIENEGVLDKIKVLGNNVESTLKEIKSLFPEYVEDVKGIGCMLGLELKNQSIAKHVKLNLMNYKTNYISGIHVKIAGDNKTLRISPNTAWGEKEINLLKSGLISSLNQL